MIMATGLQQGSFRHISTGNDHVTATATGRVRERNTGDSAVLAARLIPPSGAVGRQAVVGAAVRSAPVPKGAGSARRER
ncbi:hypothetical protein, partial [Sphingomonas hylomeconis]